MHAGYLRLKTHTRNSNTDCFSAAKMVARTRLSVKWYAHCLYPPPPRSISNKQIIAVVRIYDFWTIHLVVNIGYKTLIWLSPCGLYNLLQSHMVGHWASPTLDNSKHKAQSTPPLPPPGVGLFVPPEGKRHHEIQMRSAVTTRTTGLTVSRSCWRTRPRI